MKKLFVVLFLVLAIAMSSPAWAADVVYKLTEGDCNSAASMHGASGTNGFYRASTGDVYNEFDTLVGHFHQILHFFSPYANTYGAQTFQTIHMVELESGGLPWYNFTLQGSYSFGESIGYGAITNITEFPGSLTGAYFTMGVWSV
jgi:hypothetical protein